MPTWGPPDTAGVTRLLWHTEESGKPIVYRREPARSNWQRIKVRLLAWLPIASEL
jgi:putative cardiolipin synthase